MISKEQKAALQAAGYSVKGNSVMAKDGGSVGGYNENGKIWSGSDKVRSILKSSPSAAPATKQTSKQSTKSTPIPKKAPAPVKDAMTGYRKGDVTTSKIPKSGRGDGGAEKIRRVADNALDKAAKAPKKVKPVVPPKGVTITPAKIEGRADKKIKPGAALWKAFTRGGNPKNYN